MFSPPVSVHFLPFFPPFLFLAWCITHAFPHDRKISLLSVPPNPFLPPLRQPLFTLVLLHLVASRRGAIPDRVWYPALSHSSAGEKNCKAIPTHALQPWAPIHLATLWGWPICCLIIQGNYEHLEHAQMPIESSENLVAKLTNMYWVCTCWDFFRNVKPGRIWAGVYSSGKRSVLGNCPKMSKSWSLGMETWELLRNTTVHI